MSYPEARYGGNAGEVSATLRRATAPPDLVLGGGPAATRVGYLATGAGTNGQFGLYRWDMGPESTGPGPHFHRTISESFFVLSGTVGLYDGSGWTSATAGDFLFVPEGGVHAFRNDAPEPASMLILFAPGAPREGYFEGLAEWAASGRQVSAEERAEFFIRHDTYWVP